MLDLRVNSLAEVERQRDEALQQVVELEELIGELRTSNNELEHYAGVVAHALKQPVRQLYSHAGLLIRGYNLDNLLDHRAKESLRFIYGGARSAEEMIGGLLRAARIQSQGWEPKPYHLRYAVEYATRMLAQEIKESGAEIRYENLEDAVVSGNKDLLGCLYLCLIDNSLKFQPTGAKPEVIIGVVGSGAYWNCYVRDNGVGFEASQSERVFDMFGRAHSEEEFEGTGIGLSHCRSIVEKHGGRITAESEPGKGTTVWFTLPKPDSHS